MATVVLQYAGAAIGSFIGGPVGGIIGRAAGAIAGNMLDQAFFGGGTRRVEGPRLNDAHLMSSSEGTPLPRVFGRMRVAGEVIWATRFEEVVKTSTDSGSAKGPPAVENVEYRYFANFAVALCEGPISRVNRVWSDGKVLDLSDITHRVYRGTEAQEPDSLILAKEGAGNATAYRGVAYVVFERMPVGDFGNRIPQLSFEVVKPVGGAETQLRAVNIIPGSTEFGYDTEPLHRILGDDAVETENAHAIPTRSDFAVSLDELTATCTNVSSASLVVAWFGNDLRCDQLLLRPGVENATKTTDPEVWRVAGVERAAAHVVSQHDGGPAFGGTPSDASVIKALREISARGLRPVFYPFIMMDIPSGNGLPDPYGGGSQPAYPWRGRITCDPAPGQPGSPDKTAACVTALGGLIGTAQPSDFAVSGDAVVYSGPAEWSYRRMILHYATLCKIAGNVDAFLIGSELRGLTSLRGAGNSFPFVEALVALAADVRTILPDAKISYAADWSEYFGYQPADGSGDVFFNLDPLWASAGIDFVGIDNYMPLSDWRDGESHLDRLAGTASIHELAYLRSNIAAGEGYHWYYASDAARFSQERTAITDGASGKPWVFRYKDLKSWWSNSHYNRPGGIEAPAPTGWVAQSKPIWFTESGCPAIDKGSNQPNVFIDPKSAESLAPHFSRGFRDDLIQIQYVSALAGYWGASGDHNPVSSIYDAPMVDAARIFTWAWDARPFPYFPDRDDIWSDGPNYERGHWLNGRIGTVPLALLILRICAAYGISSVDASAVYGVVDGYLLDRIMTARDALEGLCAAFGIDAVESGGLVTFRMRKANVAVTLDPGEFVETSAEAKITSITRAQESELPQALKLSYFEVGTAYRRATVEAKRLNVLSRSEIAIDLPCALRQPAAQVRADVILQERWSGREVIEFGAPPSWTRLEPGDVVVIADDRYRIESVQDGNHRRLRAKSYDASVYDPPEAPDRRRAKSQHFNYGRPDAVFMDLPLVVSGTKPALPWIAVSSQPWPGAVILRRYTSQTATEFNRSIPSRATKGRLVTALAAGPANVFDRSTVFDVRLDYGALSSVDSESLLQGANLAAIGSAADGWEIIQFANAELIGQATYRLSLLLRGLSGSEPEIIASRSAGTRFVLLNEAVVQPKLRADEGALRIRWQFTPQRQARPANTLKLTYEGKRLGLRPLSPSQLRMTPDGGDLVFSWIRRTRIDGDDWEQDEVPLGEEREKYVFEVMDGSTVRRKATVIEPSYRYTASQIAADFGALPSQLTIRVAQISASFGRGANLLRTLHV